jgi:RecA-family ATPase
MSECAKQFFQQALGMKVINADEWLKEEPPAPDQVLGNMLDAGDKMAVLASSKVRKSFFVQQMALSLAAGRRFMGWNVPKPRRVLYVQFEIREQHSHRRIWNLARAMDIGPKDLSGRLGIIAARGLGLAGVDGLKQIRQAASDFQSEVIIFDPLYKLAQGAENAAEDFKVILSAFDELAEATGAAIIYVHHDTKGSPGDKDIRDRGAGSNVLGRDYDACIALTPHKSEQNATVVETLLRNYPPQAPFAITWNCGNGGYCFTPADGVTPEKKTSRTKPPPPPSETYLPIAETILLPGNELQIGHFKPCSRRKLAYLTPG